MIYRDLSKVEGSNKGEEAPRTNSGAVTALGLRNEGRRALGDWSTEGAVVLPTGRHDHCWDLTVEAGRNSIPPPATPHPPLLPLDKPQEKPGVGSRGDAVRKAQLLPRDTDQVERAREWMGGPQGPQVCWFSDLCKWQST